MRGRVWVRRESVNEAAVMATWMVLTFWWCRRTEEAEVSSAVSWRRVLWGEMKLNGVLFQVVQ